MPFQLTVGGGDQVREMELELGAVATTSSGGLLGAEEIKNKLCIIDTPFCDKI